MTDIENMRSLEHGSKPMGESPASARQETNFAPLPPDAMIIVPVRNFVLFPGMVMPVSIGRPKSTAAAQQAVREQRQVASTGGHPQAA